MPDQPRPLEYVWVRWEPTIYPKTKWHRMKAKDAILYGWRKIGVTCSVRIADIIYDVEFTADTPDEKDCCKKCWEKVEVKHEII